MSALLIIGAGGHGRVVADAALATGKWSSLAFLDDRAAQLGSMLGRPVVGDLGQLAAQRTDFDHAVVALGDGARRRQFFAECRRIGYQLPVLVHPSAVVSSFATVADGCVVLAQAVVGASAVLGAACIINNAATVDHDCELGEGVHLCPGAHVAGGVRIGAGSWIGIGAAVREGLRIGHGVTVGAGAVVVSDVPDGVTVVGNPARARE